MSSRLRNSVFGKYFSTMLLLRFFTLMGLAPYNVKKSLGIRSSSKKNVWYKDWPLIFVTSRFNCFYNFFLITGQMGMALGSLMAIMYTDDYFIKSDLRFICEIILAAVANFAILTIWLILAVRKKSGARLLNRILSLDGSMISLDDDYNDRPFYLLVTLTNMIVWTILLITEILAYNEPCIAYFRFAVPTFVLCWFVVQYIFMIKLIEKHFSAVNRLLSRNLFVSSRNIFQHLLVTNEVIIDNNRFNDIVSIKRAHGSIYETAMEISNFYSLPILFTIASSSYTFFYCVYYVVWEFLDNNKHSVMIISVNNIVWIVAEMLPIVMLTTGINNVTKEVKKTSVLIGKILIDTEITRDEKIVLKEFHLELLHRKLSFTACDLFSLDRTLVLSIFGNVVTYLVILIQYHTKDPIDIMQNNMDNVTTTTIDFS